MMCATSNIHSNSIGKHSDVVNMKNSINDSNGPLQTSSPKLSPKTKLSNGKIVNGADLDDSLDYIDGIEKSLKGDENPIENRDLLPKRKKS